MLGTIGSFIASPIAGGIIANQLKKAGNWALANSAKVLAHTKASGRATLNVIKNSSKIRNYQDFRTSYLKKHRTEYERIHKSSRNAANNFRDSLVKGYERRVNYISKRVGGKTRFGREVVKSAINGEVKFLPMTYLMYKKEQMEGSIPADQGFMKYYATSGLPMSLGFSVAGDVAKRSLKGMKYAAFAGKSSVFGLEAITKLGAESLHNLNKLTKGMYSVYDNAVSKYVSANQAFKAFGSTTAALKAVGRAAQETTTLGSRQRRSDLSIYDKKINRKVKNIDPKDEGPLYDSYAEGMGDTRRSITTYGKKKRELLYDDDSAGGGELIKSGFSKKVSGVHSYLRQMVGAKSYGDDVGYTTSKVLRTSPTQYSKNGTIKSRETQHWVTQNRSRIEMLGGKYELGIFHIDAIQDGMDKIATQFLNIANRPWLRFLDAGNHWLQSNKTKLITQGIQQGKGVVGIDGGKTIDIYTLARDDDELKTFYNQGDKENAALRAIRLMTKTDEDTAKSYLKARQKQAVEHVRINNQWAKYGGAEGDTQRVENYVSDKLAVGVLTRGEFQLGEGDILDNLGKHTKVHTKLENGTRATFVLHLNDSPIHSTKLLRGDTRAGQIAGGLLGGKATVRTDDGLEINTGIENNTNIKFDEYYKDHNYTKAGKAMTWLGNVLDWNGGQEQSMFSRMKSVFTKYKDPSYIGNLATDVAKGATNRADIIDMFNSKSEHPKLQEMIKGAAGYAKNLMGGVFNSLRATSIADSRDNGERQMSYMLGQIKNTLHGSKIENADRILLDSFDIDKAVINEKDGYLDIINKLQYTHQFQKANAEFLSGTHGFTDSPIRQLKEVLDNSHTRSRASALSGTSSANGDRVDQYNRQIFDFLISVSGSDKQTAQSVAKVVSEISSFGAGRISTSKLRTGESNINGISAAIHLSKHGNKFAPGAEFRESEAADFASSIETISSNWVASGRNNLMEAFSSFGKKKRIREAPGAEDKFILLPDNIVKDVSISTSDIIVNNQKVKVRHAPISRGQVEQLAAVGTMNSALSLIGLGFDLQSTFTVSDIITKTLTKRVLPMGLLFGAHDVATSLIQQTPILQNTSLAGGVTGMLWDGYAGARVISQSISDFTGITSMAQKMEELVPGSVDSPISGLIRGILPIGMGLKMGSMGRVGPMKGGMIGAGIGMILGGGPLGLFDDSWNLAKGREQVIAELNGEKEVAVSKGRFWEASGSSFWGDKISYFRPSLYALQKKQYQRADNYIGDDLSDQVMSYIDPSVYAKKHYLSRPYELVGGKLSNIPLVGTALDTLTGGAQLMHQDFLQEMSQSALLGGGTVPGISSSIGTSISSGRGSFYGGGLTGGMSNSNLPIANPNDVTAAIDTTADNMLDVAGLRGFMLGNAIDAATSSGSTGFSGGFRTESANDIASFSKSYWEKELGGLATLSEGIRRIFPNPSAGDTERINRIANIMPHWLPGKDSFTDFATGDPYSKVQMGEVRLPGDAYEKTHNVYYTYPIDSMVMGKSLEEQVSFYAGDVTYLSTLRRNWHVVERTRKELIGELKKTMPIVKESDVAYDAQNDVHGYVDAIMQDEKKVKTAIAIAPMIDNYADPGGRAQLNAYLVNNTKDIRQGLLISMDKDGNTTKQIIYADAKQYLNDVKIAQTAARQASKITKDLQEDGYSVNRWPAYSHLNRLQILVNVSPFSKEAQMEMKIVKQQLDSGQFSDKQMSAYKEIMGQFVQRLNSMKTQEYKFIPLLMGKTPMGTQSIKLREEAEQYSLPEQVIGAAGEYVTHLRNPVLNKLMGKKSMYEMYREDVALGKGFTKWQNPVEDYIGANLSLMAAEEDPFQAAMSGATGGFIFGGAIGAGLGAGISGLSSLFGLTSNSRASRLKELDDVQVLADALKYKESEELDQEYAANDRRFTLRKKSSAYYNYTEGAMIGEASGFNDVTGALSSNERSYVRRMMQNMYKEDVEKIAPLLPTHAQGLFLSYAGGAPADTSHYQQYMTDSRRVIEGAPLQFRSDDMVYKTLVSRGLDAHGLGLGWAQQVNRVKYLENKGNDIPSLNQDAGYPGVIPGFGALGRL
jgi:hypothetical protein